MYIDPVIARLGSQVGDLAGRIQGAAELTDLVNKNALPQVTPAAFVVPLGLIPRDQGDAGTGAFLQMVDEHVGVVLAVRVTGDPTGGRGLPAVGDLATAIIKALAGWEPDDDAIGVFRLVRAALVGMNAGLITYQIDFAIQTQLRITS